MYIHASKRTILICSAAIIIKEERSKNVKYTFTDFLETESDQPDIVPSSLRTAVEKLTEDENLKLVTIKAYWHACMRYS